MADAGPVDKTEAPAIHRLDGSVIDRARDLGLKTSMAAHSVAASALSRPRSVVMATVGDRVITFADGEAAADTIKRQQMITGFIFAAAEGLGVKQQPGESDDNFFNDIVDVASAQDQLGVFQDKLASFIDATRADAIFDLIDNANLRRRLHDLPEVAALTFPPGNVTKENETLKALLATRLGAASKLPEAKWPGLVDSWLSDQEQVALWAPYEATFDKAFATFPTTPDKDKPNAPLRGDLKTFVSQLLVPSYGLDAPRQFALQMKHHGGVYKLAELITATRRTTWSVQDLAAASFTDPEIAAIVQPLLHAVGLDDTALYADSQVEAKIETNGLHLTVTSKSKNIALPTLATHKNMLAWSGELLWATANGAPVFHLDDSQLPAWQSGKPFLISEAQKAGLKNLPELKLSAAQEKTIAENAPTSFTLEQRRQLVAFDSARDLVDMRLAAARGRLPDMWKSGGQTLNQLLQKTGLAPYLGDNLLAIFLADPVSGQILQREVIADLAAGKSPQSVVAHAKAIGLPAKDIESIEALARNFAVFANAHPLPRQLSDLIAGGKTAMNLPLVVDAKLTPEQQDVLAALQNYIAASGWLTRAPDHLGVMDEATVQALGLLRPYDDALNVDKNTAARIIGQLGGDAPALLKDIAADDKKKLSIPFVPGADLTPAQHALVAALQNYLFKAGKLSPLPPKIGELDASTLDALNNFAPGHDTLVIDSDFASSFMIKATTGADLPPLYVGDFATADPGFMAYRAAGGKADPMRFLLAYLQVEGFAVSLAPPRADQAFLDALVSNLGVGFDASKLAAAAKLAEQTPAPSEGDLATFMTASFSILPTRPPRAVSLGQASDLEKRNLLRRMATKALPNAARTVPGGQLGLLAMHEPVVAIKLAIAQLCKTPAPIAADGSIDGGMDRGTLLSIRGILFPNPLAPGETPPLLYTQITNTAEAIGRGELTIATLSEDFPSTLQSGKDANATLATLRQMAESVRAGTLATTTAQNAVSDQYMQWSPLAFQSRPLFAALARLGRPHTGLATVDMGDLSALEFTMANIGDVDPREAELVEVVKNARTRFAAIQPKLAMLRQAIKDGRLTLSERVTVNPPDGALASAGQDLLESIVAGAEVAQTRGRIANRGVWGTGARLFYSTIHHLARLPGFGDDFAYNTADGWMLAALRVEMGQNGAASADRSKILSTAISANPDGSLKAVAPPEAVTPTTAVAADANYQIDDKVIDYLLTQHEGMIGRGRAFTLIAGAPDQLLAHDKAVALLKKVRDEMRARKTLPWDNLDITPADAAKSNTPEELARAKERHDAKTIIQSALRSLFSASSRMNLPLAARDSIAISSTVDRMLGNQPTNPQVVLRAYLVQQGYATCAEVGDLQSTTLPPALLQKFAYVALRAADVRKDDVAGATALQKTAKILFALGNGGKALTLSGADVPGEAEQAVRELADLVSVAGDTRAQYDFSRMLPTGVKDLKIASGVHNALIAATPPTFTQASADIGAQATWVEKTESEYEKWKSRVQFDPSRAVETAINQFLMMHGLMGPMMGHDMTVAPGHQTITAVRQGLGANGDPTKQQNALAMGGAAAQGLFNNLAGYTAFFSPISPLGLYQAAGFLAKGGSPYTALRMSLGGLAQDLDHELDEGRLDVFLGKGIVYAPMLIGSTIGVMQLLKRRVGAAKQFVYYRNKPYEVSEVNTLSVTAETTKVGGFRMARRIAGTTGKLIGDVGDFAIMPQRTAGRVAEPAYKLARAAVRKTLGTGKINLKAKMKGEEIDVEVSDEKLEWMRDNLENHGGTGRVEFDAAAVRPGKGARIGAGEINPGPIEIDILLHGENHHLSWSTGDLREAADLAEDEKMSPDLAERLHISGPDAPRLARAARRLGLKLKDLPRIVETQPVTPGKRVARIGNLDDLEELSGDETTWSLEYGGELHSVRLMNSVLVKALKENAKQAVSTLSRTLRVAGVTDVEAAQLLLSQYRGFSLARLRRANRSVYLSDIGTRAIQSVKQGEMLLGDLVKSAQGKYKRAKEAIKSTFNPELVDRGWADHELANGTRRLFEWHEDGIDFSVTQNKGGDYRVRAGSEDITDTPLGKQVIEKLKSDRQKWGTLDPEKIGKIKDLQAKQVELKAKIEEMLKKPTEGLKPDEIEAGKAELTKLEESAKSLLGDLEAGARGTIKGRLNIEMLKFKLQATSFKATLAKSGLPGVRVRVVEGVREGIKNGAKEAVKSPVFWIVVAYEGSQFAIDAGHVINDDSLSRLKKAEEILKAAAIRGGTAAAGAAVFWLAMKGLTVISPEAAGALAFGGELAMAYMAIDLAMNGMRYVEHGIDAIAGYEDALPSIKNWQKVGIPEAVYLNPDGNDSASLDRNQADLVTPRTAYWYFPEDGSMHQRLRQLAGRDPLKGESPVRKPKDVDLKKVTHYREAKWTSVQFLESLEQTRNSKGGQSLLLVPEAANFSLNTWRDAVSAAVSVDSAEDENASYVAVDDGKVRALLAAQDHYEDLTAAQKKALADRTDAELNQLQMWTVLYLDQMHIPLAEKKKRCASWSKTSPRVI